MMKNMQNSLTVYFSARTLFFHFRDKDWAFLRSFWLNLEFSIHACTHTYLPNLNSNDLNLILNEKFILMGFVIQLPDDQISHWYYLKRSQVIFPSATELFIIFESEYLPFIWFTRKCFYFTYICAHLLLTPYSLSIQVNLLILNPKDAPCPQFFSDSSVS